MLALVLSLLPAAPLPLRDDVPDPRHYAGKQFTCRWGPETGTIKFYRNGTYELRLSSGSHTGCWRVRHPRGLRGLFLYEVLPYQGMPFHVMFDANPQGYYRGSFRNDCLWWTPHTPKGWLRDRRLAIELRDPKDLKEEMLP